MRSGRLSVLACLAITAIVCAVPAGASGITFTKRAVATGRGGAVASDTIEATRAGLNILDRGRHRGRRGGRGGLDARRDRPVRGRDRRRRLLRLLRRAHPPRLHDRRPRDRPGDGDGRACSSIRPPASRCTFPTAVTSGLSVGVPGTLMTWQRALQRWGRFSLAGDLAPAGAGGQARLPRRRPHCASRCARTPSGSTSSARRARCSSRAGTCRWSGRSEEPGSGPHLRADRPAGRRVPSTAGRSAATSSTRSTTCRSCSGATLVPRPGLMTLSDLAHYRAPFEAPTHVALPRLRRLRRWRRPRAAASTVGEALNILSNFDLGAESRVQALHHYLEATRLAFADRNRYVGDPRYVHVPLTAAALAATSAGSGPA